MSYLIERALEPVLSELEQAKCHPMGRAMMATSYEAVEVTAHQAWFLADYLHAGSYPWKLAITGPYVDPAERDPFNEQCRRRTHRGRGHRLPRSGEIVCGPGG